MYIQTEAVVQFGGVDANELDELNKDADFMSTYYSAAADRIIDLFVRPSPVNMTGPLGYFVELEIDGQDIRTFDSLDEASEFVAKAFEVEGA